MARILRIVDVFDAMTSRRSYKEAMPPAKVAQIMIGMPPERVKAKEGSNNNYRDQGMRQCFDESLLRRFILFLGKMTSN